MPRKRKEQEQELPDLLKSQCPCTVFTATWAGVSPQQEQFRRGMAQRLVEGRLPAGYIRWERSHGDD